MKFFYLVLLFTFSSAKPAEELNPKSAELVETVTSCPKWLLEAWQNGEISEATVVGGEITVGDEDMMSKYPQRGWRDKNPRLDGEWEAWKQKYHKYYFTKNEDEVRRLFWEDNKAIIDAHNRMFEKGIVSYRMSLTQFSDLSEHEYRHMHKIQQ